MLRRLLLFALVALAVPAGAGARTTTGPIPWVTPDSAPLGLHGFLLRADEPVTHSFPRTPSFAWTPIRQPGTYEFQLAMSSTFDDSQVLYSVQNLPAPAVAVPLQLPWMTGAPYALWAHVRFKGTDGRTTPWSAPFGFNMRWNAIDVPQQLTAPLGLIRWTPVEGATAYEVLYPDITGGAGGFLTTTNVADEREFWTFHQQFGIGALHWRVRAIRYIDAQSPLPNGLPAVSYGPWSPTFTTVNPPTALTTGPLTPSATVSDVYDKAGQPAEAHELMPGFAWTGTATYAASPFHVPLQSPLYRVYVSTDSDCVNTVFTGAVVGSPAYAPRIYGGPLDLPQNTSDVATWESGAVREGGSEGRALSATGDLVYTNENPSMPVGGKVVAAETLNGKTVAHTDLWDSGWPNGRYYWTVIPVEARYQKLVDPSTSQQTGGQPIYYQDAAVPQDACESGRVMSFGKVSEPVVARSSTPYASGLSPTGRMVAAVTKTPYFHSTPLVAWRPAIGAQTYRVEWSKTRYPWVPAGHLDTAATAVLLPVEQPGYWYYRVRGVNPALPPGAQYMTWSQPVRIRISGQVWKLVK